MGLDSVEILVQVEKTFGIQYSDSEAESISTVQDFADKTADKLYLPPSHNNVYLKVLEEVKNALVELGINKRLITENDFLKDIISPEKMKGIWLALEHKLNLKLPKLNKINLIKKKYTGKIFNFYYVPGAMSILDINIKALVDCIISINHMELIDTKSIQSKYEIERIICGTISSMMGIPIHHIQLHHSIANDLGVD